MKKRITLTSMLIVVQSILFSVSIAINNNVEVISLPVDTTECCVDCTKEHQFFSIEKAVQAVDNAHCLVLSFGQPKYTSIPKEIGKLTNLVCLDISFNRVAIIPEEILNCTQLYCIDLSGNHYLQDLPRFLKQLPNLKVIRLLDMTLWSNAKKQQLKSEFEGIYLEFE